MSDETQADPTNLNYSPEQLGHVASMIRDTSGGAPAQPQNIGPYRILEVLGSGGMGIVYKAEQREPVRRIVALKVIKLGMDTEQFVARFESERQALALMSHPNVAQVYDAGATETGRPYLVLEYVRGESITAFCNGHRLDTRQRLELFLQACDALQHAHQKAIVHRDIKPSNLLVTPRPDEKGGIVKVIDFGVAKAMTKPLIDRTLHTVAGTFIGTPEYMSPEQASSEGADVDTRSDVYSLGVVLYELMTGALPFDPRSLRQGSSNEMQRIIREVDPPRPSTRLSSLEAPARADVARQRGMQVGTLARQLRGELEWIPLKAMRKDRTERYGSVTELSEDIRAYLENRPLRAGPESTAYRVRKFVRRHRGAVLAVATVALAVLLGLAGTTWQSVRAVRAERRAVAGHREADEQRARAQAVNQFLTEDLLASASPEVARGRDITVRQAVDRAAAAVGQRFRDRPLEESAVRATLSDTYATLGQLEPALEQARAALALVREKLGPDHAITLSAEYQVASLISGSGKLTEAEAIHRDLLDRTRRAVGDDHSLTLNCKHGLAMTLRRQGKFDDAEALYRQALEGDRRVHGPTSKELVLSLNSLGLLLQQRNRPADAEALYREALAITGKHFGQDHPLHLAIQSNLATLLQNLGKLDEAEPVLRQVLSERRRVLGNDHFDTFQSVNNLGFLLSLRRKFDEAESLYREALAGRERLLSRDHPDTVQSMHNLGLLLEQTGKRSEAEPLLSEALERRRRLLGEDHPSIYPTMGGLSAIFEKSGRWSEAEPLLARLNDPQVIAKFPAATQAQMIARYGVCLAKLGQLERAEPMLLKADHDMRENRQERTELMQIATRALVELYEKQGRPDDAAAWRAKLSPTTQPATHPATAP